MMLVISLLCSKAVYKLHQEFCQEGEKIWIVCVFGCLDFCEWFYHYDLPDGKSDDRDVNGPQWLPVLFPEPVIHLQWRAVTTTWRAVPF